MNQAIQVAQSESVVDWQAMREQASALVRSGFLPRAVDTPEKALAIMQTGRELGIGPMQALRCIHIIDGKPVMAAELIAGLVFRHIPGALLRVAETTDKQCVVFAARPGQEPTKFAFTIEDAQRAGLTGKQNWRGYPRAMLRNRCIAEAARAIFADATMGLYDPDELGAVTTPSGEIVDRKPGSVAEEMMGSGPPDSSPGESEERLQFANMERRLKVLEDRVAWARTYEETLLLRGDLGSRAKQSQLLKDMQEAGPDRRLISGIEYKALCKAWARIDRQLSKLEAQIKPDCVDSFTDPPAREPGVD